MAEGSRGPHFNHSPVLYDISLLIRTFQRCHLMYFNPSALAFSMEVNRRLPSHLVMNNLTLFFFLNAMFFLIKKRKKKKECQSPFWNLIPKSNKKRYSKSFKNVNSFTKIVDVVAS